MRKIRSAEFNGLYASPFQHPDEEVFQDYIQEATQRLLTQLNDEAEKEGKEPDWSTLKVSSGPGDSDHWEIRASVTAYNKLLIS